MDVTSPEILWFHYIWNCSLLLICSTRECLIDCWTSFSCPAYHDFFASFKCLCLFCCSSLNLLVLSGLLSSSVQKLFPELNRPCFWITHLFNHYLLGVFLQDADSNTFPQCQCSWAAVYTNKKVWVLLRAEGSVWLHLKSLVLVAFSISRICSVLKFLL